MVDFGQNLRMRRFEKPAEKQKSQAYNLALLFFIIGLSGKIAVAVVNTF